MNTLKHMNLQLFAENDADQGGNEEQEKEQQNTGEESGEQEQAPKTFTQKELDDLISAR